MSVATRYRATTDALLVTVVTKDVPWLAIGGSTTKRVRVKRIVLSTPTLTASELLQIQVQKTSTAGVGAGTDLVKVPVDGAGIASTLSMCRVYTVAPTRGTLVGGVATRRVLGLVPALTVADSRPAVVFDLDVTLDGAADNLVLCFIGSNAGSAVSMHVEEIAWEEEG